MEGCWAENIDFSMVFNPRPASPNTASPQPLLCPCRTWKPRLVVRSCLPSAGRAKRANKINDFRVAPGTQGAQDPGGPGGPMGTQGQGRLRRSWEGRLRRPWGDPGAPGGGGTQGRPSGLLATLGPIHRTLLQTRTKRTGGLILGGSANEKC